MVHTCDMRCDIMGRWGGGLSPGLQQVMMHGMGCMAWDAWEEPRGEARGEEREGSGRSVSLKAASMAKQLTEDVI